MNSLNQLRNIISSFQGEEIKSLEKHINYLKSGQDLQISKSAQLLKFLLESQVHSPTDIQKAIYGKQNYSAFNKLVNRLREKALEVMLFSSNIKSGSYAERSRTIFELRKRMIQIDMLILKGLRRNILEEINLVIKKAKEYEIYDVLVQALHTKQRFQGVDLGQSQADNLKIEIQKAEFQWTSLNYSQSKFNELISMINSSSNPDSYKTELAFGLGLLKTEYERTDSATIGYYYKLLLVEKFQNEKNYKKAGESLIELITLIDNNSSVYSKFRIGSMTLNIANNFIFLKELDASLEKLIIAKEYFANQPVNLAILNEIEFYNLFYRGDLDQSSLCLDDLIKYTRTVNTPLLLDKRIFFKGCLRFIQGDYQQALDLIIDCNELDKDKEGWNITKRIMITLCRIEIQDYESVDLKINSLDKFIKRLLKTKNVRPRYLIIIRILRKLINENFDYRKVYTSRLKYFNQLSSDDSDYRWEIKSPELVIFDEWFRSKMKKKTYDHKIIMNNIFK